MQPFIGVAGELYSTVPGSGTFTLHSAISGLSINTDVRPSFALLGNACIIAGKFSRPVVYYDDIDKFYAAGLTAPTGTPAAASGGGGNVTGECIYYYTFVHEESGKRAESNPSPASNTFSASANDVDLSNIDATAPDSRVNKVYIYCSRDGAIPRKVGSVNLGTTTFTDNMTAAALAEQVALPVKLDSDGATILDIDARGIPPYTEIVKEYHNRAWYGRDPNHMHYVWFSSIDEPESVNLSVPDPNLPPLGTLKTRGNEGVRGLVEALDELLVMHEGGTDGIQGYGPTTFQVRRISRLYTTISHHSICIVGDGIPMWAAEDGVIAYDGSFRNVMADTRRNEFRDAVRTNTAAYQDSVAAYDRHEHVYKLMIPKASGPTRYWIGHCLPMLEGQGMPFWTDDYENREVTAIGNLALSATDRRKEMYHAATDGYVRRQNIAADADDDGDTYLKHFEVWTKAFLPRGSQGGDDGHGVTVTEVTFFVKNESVDVSIAGHAGDDEAHTATAQWTHTIPAGAATIEGVSASARTSYHTASLDGMSGKTVLFKISADSPVGVEYRGLEFMVRAGSQTRPA